VDHERLERAVAAFPVVRSLEVSADFPHGLVIHVVEHHPAAIVEVGAQRLPVASDGTLLRGLPVEGRLPALDAKAGVRGERLAGRAALGAAHVAGTAPRALLGRLERVETRADDGIVVTMREGPELIFGDATRARAKWIAAARVLADPQAAGATYLDLRLPGRPAAGGLPAETLAPVAPAGITPADPAAGVTGAAPDGPALSGAPTTVTDPALTAPAGEPTTASPPAAETPGEPPTLDDGTGAGAVAAPTG
jgi:cell division protein FtsQ